MHPIGLATAALFNTSAHLALADVATIAPDVPKKFIRNMTDRELIRLIGQSDPRLYTLQNVIQLQGMHLGSVGGSSLSVARLIGAAMARRAEERISDRVIGTDRDMRVTIYRLSTVKLRPGEGTREQHSIHARTCAVEDVPEALKSFWTDEPGEARALPVDEIIEALVARYKEWAAAR